ncbi:GNAT family N-acetyltransferase [Bifidobacterium felsineum]|uniref:GNAT family N-acetyltransferase n=1 Tax=Bifidobacterium felsineum TaxID=2045440 RepID=UPI003B84AA3F
MYLSSDNWIRLGVADDGEIATYCAVARRAPDVFEVALIAVASSYRGRGLGRDALADAIRCARAQSIRQGREAHFVAYIDIRNERSMKLFHDFGFEQIKQLAPDRRGNVFVIWALR